jgi:hypothetical protein
LKEAAKLGFSVACHPQSQCAQKAHRRHDSACG